MFDGKTLFRVSTLWQNVKRYGSFSSRNHERLHHHLYRTRRSHCASRRAVHDAEGERKVSELFPRKHPFQKMTQARKKSRKELWIERLLTSDLSSLTWTWLCVVELSLTFSVAQSGRRPASALTRLCLSRRGERIWVKWFTIETIYLEQIDESIY